MAGYLDRIFPVSFLTYFPLLFLLAPKILDFNQEQQGPVV